jgi:hypothetical protein
LKEAYAAEFAATIERAEKQIILARHGRRLLNLLDDTPVVPGDQRNPYQYANEARQILNDAEDDLKDWQPDLEDVTAQGVMDPHGVSGSEQQRFQPQTTTAGSVAGTESVNHQEQPVAAEGSRVSSGASVTTGPVEPSYAPSEAGTVPVQVA